MAKKDISSDRTRYLLDKNTPFIISEGYKTARTNLMFSLASGHKKIIAITSASPSEGKSTTCCNLAITLADMNASVLLIDADLRKPTIHTIMNVRNKNGLSSILGGFCNVAEAITENVRENLDVISAGPIPPNPADLLASDVMANLLAILREHYDYILIDTPPVGVVSDSQQMNSVISGIVFVVHEGKTTHPDLQAAMRGISLSGGKILGFVKINCNAKGTRSYNKYRYHYNYQAFDKRP